MLDVITDLELEAIVSLDLPADVEKENHYRNSITSICKSYIVVLSNSGYTSTIAIVQRNSKWFRYKLSKSGYSHCSTVEFEQGNISHNLILITLQYSMPIYKM